MPLSIATFNVKDLLPPSNEGARVALPDKLDFIARMLRACDADVVGLQEIGPPELLDAVVDRLPVRGGYGAPVMGTADARGIRCALLARVAIVSSRVHTAASLSFPTFRAGDPPPFGDRIPLRRGIVQARVLAPGIGEVDVFVAHFKSSRPVPARDREGLELPAATARERAEAALRSLVWREAEALHVRGLVDESMARRDGGAPPYVAVVGDLNDTPESPVVRTLRGGERDVDALFDCAARIEARARFSTLHDGHAAQIDHALASAGLYGRLEAAQFLHAELREHPPVPSDADDYVPTTDSDHAPLVARFG
jgi:endonuclease/exonuclease/phosphatase family metal-dependent hydrolase